MIVIFLDFMYCNGIGSPTQHSFDYNLRFSTTRDTKTPFYKSIW